MFFYGNFGRDYSEINCSLNRRKKASLDKRKAFFSLITRKVDTVKRTHKNIRYRNIAAQSKLLRSKAFT